MTAFPSEFRRNRGRQKENAQANDTIKTADADSPKVSLTYFHKLLTMTDYDYGYGDSADDYGYGDAAPAEDYGYGDSADDYGYGDAAPAEDYGYGDQAAAEDYGYGDAVPEEVAPKRRTPKRRCSVTKYSLVSAAENGGAEAEMVKNLNAAEMLNQFRNGGGLPPSTQSIASTDSKSVDTVGTAPQSEEVSGAACEKKISKFSRFRKRLSIFG